MDIKQRYIEEYKAKLKEILIKTSGHLKNQKSSDTGNGKRTFVVTSDSVSPQASAAESQEHIPDSTMGTGERKRVEGAAEEGKEDSGSSLCNSNSILSKSSTVNVVAVEKDRTMIVAEEEIPTVEIDSCDKENVCNRGDTGGTSRRKALKVDESSQTPVSKQKRSNEGYCENDDAKEESSRAEKIPVCVERKDGNKVRVAVDGDESQKEDKKILVEIKIARRGKKRGAVVIRKRRAEEFGDECNENEHKRVKIEKTEPFTTEYRRMCKELLANKEKEAENSRESKELEELRRRLEELEAKRMEERAEAERIREELERLRAESSQKLCEEKELELRKIKEEGEAAARKIREEMEKLLALKQEITGGAIAQRVPPPAVNTLLPHRYERHQTVKITPFEPVSLQVSSARKQVDINTFFQMAKQEHIERINRTMICRSEDKRALKADFKPSMVLKQNTQKAFCSPGPHTLYKDSIDSFSTSVSPKNYVPHCKIPFYATEDEFNCDEKRFAPAPFATDPKLTQIVRMQDHAKLEKYFGGEKDIDVEKIFSNIENVSNYSPNKFVQK